MKTSNLLAVAGGVVCAAALMADAMAASNYGVSRKIVTGAQCQPSNGSQWPDILINPEGIRNNHASQNRYVSCALVLDFDDSIDVSDSDPTTAPGTFLIDLALDYSAVTSGSPVTNCTLIRYDSDGTRTTQAFPPASAPPGTTGYVYTNLSSPAVADGTSPISADTLSVNCRLPPKVRLMLVKTYEYADQGGYYYTP